MYREREEYLWSTVDPPITTPGGGGERAPVETATGGRGFPNEEGNPRRRRRRPRHVRFRVLSLG